MLSSIMTMSHITSSMQHGACSTHGRLNATRSNTHGSAPAEDGSPHAGNRIELEAMHDQLYRKGQTAQMAMLNAHKERVEWDHEGGKPPLQSHYGQVCSSMPVLTLN